MSSHTTAVSAPTHQLLTQELNHFAGWQNLGTFIGMTEDEIREIELDHPAGDTARRRTAMLDKWLKKQENPSWISIIEALEKMSEMSLANKLRNKYMSPSPRPSKQPAQAHVCLAEIQPNSCDVLLEVDRSDPFTVNMEELKDLYYELVTETEKGLESVNPRDIERFSEHYMTEEMTTVKELLDQLKPIFFLDFALLEKIIKVLLKQNQSAVNKIDDYIQQLEQFKKSATLQEYIEKIETRQKASPQTCTVTLKLRGSWLKRTIRDLEKLLEELSHNKAAVPTHFNVVRKCVLVTYLVQRSEARSLIEAAQAKISFMMKVGVSVLQVGDTVVTSTQSKTSDFSFESSLIRSVIDNDIDVLSFLLDINTSPDASDDKGRTSLLLASYLGRTKAVKLLLKANGDPNLHRDDGVTPLFMASQKGHSDIVSFLLEANADSNLCRDNGVTPLFMASQNGYSEVIHLLLKANANPNLHRIDGVTPLFVASENGHSDIVEFLLKANADPNHCRDDGVTPLFMASQNGHSDIVSFLLKASADPNHCRDDGATPLMIASQYGHIAIVVSLLNANANPNHQTDKGMTPLMVACSNRHPKIVKLLLTNKANPDLRDSNGSNALAFAQRSDSLESIKLILAFGKDSFPQTLDLSTIVSDLEPSLSQTPGYDMVDKGT